MTRRTRNEHWNEEAGRWESTNDGQYDYAARPPLRRNKIDGILGGVCAGIGDWLGLGHGVTRVFFVLTVIFTGLPIFIYFLMWLFIPADKRAPYVREYRERKRAERVAPSSGTRAAPESTVRYADVRSKFRSLEERMQDLERSVTSREWRLRREFRDLEG